jgi:Ca2+-binding RTX toxin-like protein
MLIRLVPSQGVTIMATLAGTLFNDYSTLNLSDQAALVSAIGSGVFFNNLVVPSGGNVNGSPDNDVYILNEDTNVKEKSGGGTDIIISDNDIELPNNVEGAILTGSSDSEVEGNSKDNVIAGNNGDNELEGKSGNDAIAGGAGDDDIEGDSGDDTLLGGEGNDDIEGGSGSDSILGGIGNDRIDGGAGGDTIYGEDGNDTIDGDSGNDCISGGLGDDCIKGGQGADTILAGDGNDSMDGGVGADSILGEAGNDTIIGGQGSDTMSGGTGEDQFYFSSGSGKDVITDFDVLQDKIVIQSNLNNTNISDFGDLSISDNLNGDAVVNLGNGNNIKLQGVHTGDLASDDFFFVS